MHFALILLLLLSFLFSAAAYTFRESDERTWFTTLEGGLGIGYMDHTLDEGLEGEYFDLDTLRPGGEQDGMGFRAGLGRKINDELSIVLYGGGSRLYPGFYFDNHGPFIPPELTYDLRETLVGIEVRMGLIKLGAGGSFYTGDAALSSDEREDSRATEWEGPMDRGSGFHLIAGIQFEEHSLILNSFELIYRNIPLDFPETPTGENPGAFNKSMVELRASFLVDVFLF